MYDTRSSYEPTKRLPISLHIFLPASSADYVSMSRVASRSLQELWDLAKVWDVMREDSIVGIDQTASRFATTSTEMFCASTTRKWFTKNTKRVEKNCLIKSLTIAAPKFKNFPVIYAQSIFKPTYVTEMKDFPWIVRSMWVRWKRFSTIYKILNRTYREIVSLFKFEATIQNFPHRLSEMKNIPFAVETPTEEEGKAVDSAATLVIRPGKERFPPTKII